MEAVSRELCVVATVGVWSARPVRGVTLSGIGGATSSRACRPDDRPCDVGRASGGGGGADVRTGVVGGPVGLCGARCGGGLEGHWVWMRSRLESFRMRKSIRPMLAASSSQCWYATVTGGCWFSGGEPDIIQQSWLLRRKGLSFCSRVDSQGGPGSKY